MRKKACYYQREVVMYNQNVAKLNPKQQNKVIRTFMRITKEDLLFLDKYNLYDYIGGKEIELYTES